MQALALLTLIAAPVAVDDCGSKKAVATTAAHVENAKDIVTTAVEAGNFTILAKALGAADLVGALQSDGPFTVFAPTDEAFHALPKGTLETLLKPENKAMLTSILTYHVVPGRLMAKDVVELDAEATLAGQRVEITVDEGAVRIDDATVTATDVSCSNGVIHVIDRVILPNTDDILTTAVEAGAFNTLAAAIKAAGLVEALSGDGPFTVFAPTDEAFAKLPEGTVESLLKPENKHKLVSILKHHVVSGRVFADQAIGAGRFQTLEGTTLRARIVGGRLRIGDANVTASDLDTKNGVIHVIDSVLLP